MKKTTRPPMIVLSQTVRTNLQEITKHIAIPDEMYKEASACGMRVTGCNYWIYSGCSGEVNADFNLEIVLPVQPNGMKSNRFEIKQLPQLQCVTYLHEGSWEHFKTIYPRLMQEIIENGFLVGGLNREMYIHSDFEHPENCITEIQIEVN